MKRIRVPLSVEAIFRTDGSLVPKQIIYRGTGYPVTRILGVRPFYPAGISCISPVCYTVEVDSRRRELYYEADTGLWFSVKETV